MLAHKQRSGFTLLEVLLVMAILIVLISVALPSLDALYGDTKVRGGADDVRGAWAEARVRAIDNGISYRFAIIPGTEKFCISPDTSDYTDGTTEVASDAEMDDGRVLVGSMPKGIKFKLAQDLPEEAGGWRTIVSFLPDGTCRDDARIEVEGRGSQPLIVSVRGLTGIVTVQTKKQEEGR